MLLLYFSCFSPFLHFSCILPYDSKIISGLILQIIFSDAAVFLCNGWVLCYHANIFFWYWCEQASTSRHITMQIFLWLEYVFDMFSHAVRDEFQCLGLITAHDYKNGSVSHRLIYIYMGCNHTIDALRSLRDLEQPSSGTS